MYISTVILDEDNMGSIHYLDLTLYPYMSPRTNYRKFKRKEENRTDTGGDVR